MVVPGRGVDTWINHIGGSVYSTGTDDIILKVLVPNDLPWPGEVFTAVIGGKPVRLPNPNVSAYINGLYILTPSPARFVATNRQYGRILNLGKFPPGEIVFAIQTPDGNTFKTGPATRNADNLPHVYVRTYLSGAIELWFEDQYGPQGPASDSDFNDLVVQLRGGVADNNSVAELLKTIREQTGEARQQAIAALRVNAV